jgi:hypothetical protein
MTDTAMTAPVSRPSTVAQVVAAVVAVVVAVLLAFGLPRLADSSAPEDVAVAGGEPVTAGGVTVTPPQGWALAGGTDLMVLNQGDAKFFVLPPTPSTQAPADAVLEAEAGYTDATVHSTIGEVQTFTTSGGLDAASVTITQPDLVTTLYAFSDGTSLATGNAAVTPSSWPAFQDEIDAIAATAAFVPEETS